MSGSTHRHPSLVKPYPSVRMWLPIVVHSEPLMTPIFLTDKIVKKRSLSARSFQFLLFMVQKDPMGEQSAEYLFVSPLGWLERGEDKMC
jgi:hypothetical protein